MKQKYITGVVSRQSSDRELGGNFVSRSGSNSGTPGNGDSYYKWTQKIIETNATGNDKVYQLPYEPSAPATMLLVYINGILQRNGIDYTVSGKTLTFTQNVFSGSNIIVFYNFKN